MCSTSIIHRRMNKLLLLATAFLYCLAICTAKDRFTALPIPLKVPVWVSGLSVQASSELLKALSSILPYYTPRGKDGKGIHDIELKVSFDVKPLSESFLTRYEMFIRDQPSAAEGNTRNLEVDDVASFLLRQIKTSPEFAETLDSSDLFTLPIIIVNGVSVPDHKIVPRSAGTGTAGSECTQSVIGPVALMDLTAHACDIRNNIAHNAKSLRWSTPAAKFPYPFTFSYDIEPAYLPSVSPESTKLLTAKLAGIVTSAVQSIAVGSLKMKPTLTTDKVYCPIIILRNGGVDEKKAAVEPNLDAIKAWLKSTLLPTQELVLVSSTHYVDEHPQLAVAIADAHMTYAASVEPTADDIRSSQVHSERIPFLDTTVLFHELNTVGDQLLHLLLSQTGHGEVVREVLQLQAANLNVTDKKARMDLAKSEEQWRSSAIVPVFVLSDLHIHHERATKTSSLSPSSADLPVQPLFNKDASIAIRRDSSAVLLLHASEETVAAFAPSTHSWRTMDLRDVDSLIAEGLTRALTGLSAPHAQLQESKDIVDLTWTHGIHPFRPFGVLPAAAVPGGGAAEGSGVGVVDLDTARVMTHAARRTLLISKAHHVMKRAHDVSERTQALKGEIFSAFHTLMAIKGSSEQAGLGLWAVDNSKSVGKFSPKVAKALPTKLNKMMVMLDAAGHAWRARIRLVVESFALKDIQKVLEQLLSLEGGLQDAEDTLKEFEEAAYLQMTNCFIEFDQVAGLGATVAAHTKKGKSIISRVAMSPGSRVNDFGHGKKVLRISFALIGLICLVALATGIMQLQKIMQAKAKKIK